MAVTLTDALGNASGNTWNARIVRNEGRLDELSRELFAIARIDDPFGLANKAPELRMANPSAPLFKARFSRTCL